MGLCFLADSNLLFHLNHDAAVQILLRRYRVAHRIPVGPFRMAVAARCSNAAKFGEPLIERIEVVRGQELRA